MAIEKLGSFIAWHHNPKTPSEDNCYVGLHWDVEWIGLVGLSEVQISYRYQKMREPWHVMFCKCKYPPPAHSQLL
jgi:hypothetical protein